MSARTWTIWGSAALLVAACAGESDDGGAPAATESASAPTVAPATEGSAESQPPDDDDDDSDGTAVEPTADPGTGTDDGSETTGGPDDPIDPPETDSALGMLADELEPGECVELATTGLGNDLLASENDGGSLTEFTNEMSWDPTNGRMYIVGTARGDSASYGPDNQRWVMYDVADNAWTLQPSPPFYVGFHSYDHAAVDTTNGDYYVRRVAEPLVHRYRPSDDAWEQLPAIPAGYGSGCCDLLEYFPEMGMLVYMESYGDSGEFWGFSDGAWQMIAAPADIPMGTFHLTGEHSPALGLLYFGGGQVYPFDDQFGVQVYTLDAAGAVTRLPDAPGFFDVAAAVTVTDPQGGNLLVFPESAPDDLWEYDASADSWEVEPSPCPFTIDNAYDDMVTVATALPEYGVIAFVKHDTPGGSNTGMWIYKHDSL